MNEHLSINNPTALLGAIKNKAAQLSHLNSLLHAQLETSLTQCCRVANFRENILIIEINSSAWATRLRYLIPELLQKLRREKEFHRLQEIKWYIRPAESEYKKKPTKSIKLSEGSSKLIAETAEHISNPMLQTALKKLTSHITK